MARIMAQPVTIWLLLVAASFASYATADRAAAPRVAATIVILIAAFKIRLIFIHFMELKRHVLPWRLVFEAWIAVVTTVILAAYWTA